MSIENKPASYDIYSKILEIIEQDEKEPNIIHYERLLDLYNKLLGIEFDNNLESVQNLIKKVNQIKNNKEFNNYDPNVGRLIFLIESLLNSPKNVTDEFQKALDDLVNRYSEKTGISKEELIASYLEAQSKYNI